MAPSRILTAAVATLALVVPVTAAHARPGECNLILSPPDGATDVPTNVVLMAGFLAFDAYLYNDAGDDLPFTSETRDGVIFYYPDAELVPLTQYYFDVMAGLQGGVDTAFVTGAGPDATAPVATPVVTEVYGEPDRGGVPCRRPGNVGVRLTSPITAPATIAIYIAPEGTPLDTTSPYFFGHGSDLELMSGCSYAFPGEGIYDVGVAVLGANGLPGPIVAAGSVDLTKGCAVVAPGRASAPGALAVLTVGLLALAVRRARRPLTDRRLSSTPRLEDTTFVLGPVRSATATAS